MRRLALTTPDKALDGLIARVCALIWLGSLLLLPAGVIGAQAAQDKAPEVLISGGWVNVVEGRASYEHGALAYVLPVGKQLESGDLISTGRDARIELLLNPGYYLRLGAQTECRFLDTDVDNIKLQLDAGTAGFEVLKHDDYRMGDVPDTLAYELITIVTPSGEIAIRMGGIYRINVAADGRTELFVREGEAVMGRARVKAQLVAHMAASGAVEVNAFDPKVEDSFDVWCRKRAQALVAANRTLKNSAWRKAQRNGAEVALDVSLPKAQGQSRFVVSAAPGLVNFVEADVDVRRTGEDWQELATGGALKTGDTLRTGAHRRVELLLLPDVYLRVDGDSEVAFTELSFDAVALRLLRGAAILDVVKFEQKRSPQLAVSGPLSTFMVVGAGNYRLDSKPGGDEMLVRKGRVVRAGQTIGSCRRVVGGVAMNCADDDEDSFDLWSAERGKDTRLDAGSLGRFLAKLNSERVMWTGFWHRQTQQDGYYTFVPYTIGFRSPYGGDYPVSFFRWRRQFISPMFDLGRRP